MIKFLVLWLIKKYLPGFHLSKNPTRMKKEEACLNGDL